MLYIKPYQYSIMPLSKPIQVVRRWARAASAKVRTRTPFDLLHMNSEHVSRACESAIKLSIVFFRPYAATAPSPISRPALLSSDCSIQSGESGVKASQGLLGTVRFIFVGASEERHPPSETDDWTRVGYEVHYHNRRVFKDHRRRRANTLL